MLSSSSHFWLMAVLSSVVLYGAAIAGLATLIAFVAGIALAFRCQRSKNQLTKILGIIFMLPLFFPPSIAVLLFLLLEPIQSEKSGWLAEAAVVIFSSLPLSVIVGALLALPAVYHIAIGAFHRIDGTLHDVARVYGLAGWRTSLPLARNGLALATVCGFVKTISELGTLAVISNRDFDFTNTQRDLILVALLFFVILTTTVSVVALMYSSRLLPPLILQRT